MGRHGKSESGRCPVLRRTAGGLAKGSEGGRGPGVSKRMHRRAGAHRRFVGRVWWWAQNWAQSMGFGLLPRIAPMNRQTESFRPPSCPAERGGAAGASPRLQSVNLFLGHFHHANRPSPCAASYGCHSPVPEGVAIAGRWSISREKVSNLVTRSLP